MYFLLENIIFVPKYPFLKKIRMDIFNNDQ